MRHVPGLACVGVGWSPPIELFGKFMKEHLFEMVELCCGKVTRTGLF